LKALGPSHPGEFTGGPGASNTPPKRCDPHFLDKGFKATIFPEKEFGGERTRCIPKGEDRGLTI